MRWFEVKREQEPPSVWAPPGAPYLININHPLMREEYERAKRAFRVPHIYPMGDVQRWVWEMDIIQRYCGRGERSDADNPSTAVRRSPSPYTGEAGEDRMPAHVVYRLKVPPYRELWETTPSTAVRRSPSLDEGGEDVGIKKDR